MPKINFYVSGNDFMPDDIKTFKIGLVIPLNFINLILYENIAKLKF